MTEFKHGKYIVTGPKKDLVVPDWGGSIDEERTTRMMYVDNEVIKGAFYFESVWFWPTDKEDKASPAPHSHEYDEMLAFFGTNFEDPFDLGAEVELWIDGEQNLMNRCFVAYIPAGVMHCPLNVLKITRPVLHLATGSGKQYF